MEIQKDGVESYAFCHGQVGYISVNASCHFTLTNYPLQIFVNSLWVKGQTFLGSLIRQFSAVLRLIFTKFDNFLTSTCKMLINEGWGMKVFCLALPNCDPLTL